MFKIPFGDEQIKTEEDEISFIEHYAKETGRAILRIIEDEDFRPCYKHAINRDNQWNAISNPEKPTQLYWKYAEDARVQLIHCKNLNKHLVKEDATALVAKLFATNLKNAKYTPQDVTSDSDDTGDSNSTGSGTDNSSVKTDLLHQHGDMRNNYCK